MNKSCKLIKSDNLFLQRNTTNLVYNELKCNESSSLISKMKENYLSNIKIHCTKLVFNEKNLNITK